MINETEEPDAVTDADTDADAAAAAQADAAAPIFDRRDDTDANRHRRAVFGVPIQVVVSVGRASPSIGDLLKMRRDALLPLDTKVEDPVEIIVGKRVIARGELQELEDGEGRLGVRLTEIVDLNEPF